MRSGDHIKRPLLGVLWHHGIYVGSGQVIDFAQAGGDASVKGDNNLIRLTTLDQFADGKKVSIVHYRQCLPADQTVQMARSQLGKSGYDLFGNNCEHFARWCKTGEFKSEQVENAKSAAAGSVGTGTLAAASIPVVAASGTVAGLSGAGVMSGLAAVGGTAIGGLGVLATAPAAVSVVAMRRVLKDDPALATEERGARAAGRTGTVVGAVGGAAGAVTAISAAGTVGGLSAAGITSGLAAIGGAVGGGMVAGVAVTVAAPAAAAVAVGYGVYKLVKWIKG